MKYDYLIVGSGLFGSIFAYEANKKGKKPHDIHHRLPKHHQDPGQVLGRVPPQGRQRHVGPGGHHGLLRGHHRRGAGEHETDSYTQGNESLTPSVRASADISLSEGAFWATCTERPPR